MRKKIHPPETDEQNTEHINTIQISQNYLQCFFFQDKGHKLITYVPYTPITKIFINSVQFRMNLSKHTERDNQTRLAPCESHD